MELVKYEKPNIIEFFESNNIDRVLEAIEKEVSTIAPDIKSARGRKEIASLAHKVAKSKTYLDELGKDLVSGWKEKAKKIDSERRKSREFLDNLKEKVREPLTLWENKEKERVSLLTEKLDTLKEKLSIPDVDSNSLKGILASVEETIIDNSWQEFEAEARDLKKEIIESIKNKISKTIQQEKEQAELEQLRKEKELRDKKDHEERIAREAAEKARIEAEEKARIEKEESFRREKEAIELVKRKEQERLEAEKRAAIEKKEALERAEQEKIRAVELEKERARKEQEAKNLEIKKREENLKHRADVHNFLVKSFMECSAVSESDAKLIITEIAKNKIDRIKILY